MLPPRHLATALVLAVCLVEQATAQSVVRTDAMAAGRPGIAIFMREGTREGVRFAGYLALVMIGIAVAASFLMALIG